MVSQAWPAWRRSSVVEQGTHKPLVVSPTLTAATTIFVVTALRQHNRGQRVDSPLALLCFQGMLHVHGGLLHAMGSGMCATVSCAETGNLLATLRLY